MEQTEKRFWAKINKTPSCWEWVKAFNAYGYGQIRVNGKLRMAHRFAYELLVGEIPKGLDLDHLCRNRACVNPDHLEPVTHKVNVRRGDTGLHLKLLQESKAHCPKGHPYNAINTYLRPDRPGRECKECGKEARIKYRMKLSYGK